MTSARPTFALLVASSLLAGCAEKPTGVAPEDWAHSYELLAHMTARYHSGGFDARVFPQDEAPSRPASCKAYRAGQEYPGDKCTVMTSDSEHWFPIGDPPWGLWGTWEGRAGDTADDPDPALPRTLVAFDAGGLAVAHWDGAEHPEASHSTE